MIENSNEKVNDSENINVNPQNSNNHNHLKPSKNEEITNMGPIKKKNEKKIQIIMWLKNKKDLKSITLLIILYIIQGLPFGLSTAIPLILGSRRASYSDQGTFSFAFYPLAVKLLWAPIVDSVYCERIGRRKTWMIPCQFLSGIILLLTAQYVNNLLDYEKENDAKSDIYALTLIFIIINIISATQDIVLDGWSLELLTKENVAWQSICNNVGFGAGMFIGNAAFLTFESQNFCNEYIRPIFNLPSQSQGLITYQGFAYFFGSVCVLCSIMLLIFKDEDSKKKLQSNSTLMLNIKNRNNYNIKLSIINTYKLIWTIFQLCPMKKLIFILFTIRICFSSENVGRLKLIEYGVARENLSLLTAFVSPLLLLVPFMLRKFINGPNPLEFLKVAYCFALLVILINTCFIYITPQFKNAKNEFTYQFYIAYFLVNILSTSISFILNLTLGCFFAQISDKKIGGTYMTFVGLWLSLGRNWSGTFALYLTNYFSFKHCDFNPILNHFPFNSTSNITVSASRLNYTFSAFNATSYETNKCLTKQQTKICSDVLNGKCVTTFDAYFVISICFVTIGFFWIFFTRKLITKLQNVPKNEWLVSNDQKDQNVNTNGSLLEESI